MKDRINEYHNNNHKHWWSCWWSPEKPEARRAGNQTKIIFLSEWWGAVPHRVNLKFDNTVLNDASYLTWYILGVIMITIDTPVSFGINYRSAWERWRVDCGSSFYTIIDWWFVNVDSINVHLLISQRRRPISVLAHGMSKLLRFRRLSPVSRVL